VDLSVGDDGLPLIETYLAALAGLIASGRLKVDASGITLTADIVQADMEQVTGVPPLDRDLYDLWSLLGSPAQAGEAADAAALVAAPLVGQSFITVADCLQSDGFGGANPNSAYGKLAFILDALTNPGVMGSVAESTYNTAWSLSNILNTLGAAFRDGSGWGEPSSFRVVAGPGAGAEQLATEWSLQQAVNALIGGPSGQGLADLLIGSEQVPSNYSSYMEPGDMLAAGLFGGPNGSSLARMLIGSWQPSSTYQGDMEPGAMLASGLFGGPNSTSVARKLTAYSQYVMDMDLGDFLAEALCTSGSGIRIADLLSPGPSSGYTITRLLEEVIYAADPLRGAYCDGGGWDPSSFRVVAGPGAGGEQIALDWSVRGVKGDPEWPEQQRTLYDLWRALADPSQMSSVAESTYNSAFSLSNIQGMLTGPSGTAGEILHNINADNNQFLAALIDTQLESGAPWWSDVTGTGYPFWADVDSHNVFLDKLAGDSVFLDIYRDASVFKDDSGRSLLYHADLNMPVSYLLGNAAGGVADHVYAGLRSGWSGMWLPDMLQGAGGETAISVLKDLADDSAFRRDGVYADWTTLSAPGVTADESFDYALSDHTLQVKVNNIDTDVVVRLEGSIDETGWFPLAADLTITANGTYAIFASGRPVYYVRGNFVSESGGTAATVKLVYQGLR